MTRGLHVLAAACALTAPIALAGCRQLFGIDPTDVVGGDAPTTDDGSSGDGPAGVDASLCFGRGLEIVCLRAPVAGTVAFQDQIIDTDAQGQCNEVVSTTTPACVVAGTTIDVAGHVTAKGSRPLVLVATDLIHVRPGGSLDVSSALGTTLGAAGDSTACQPGSDATQSGGGAGGTFGAIGGNGGDGASGGVPGNAAPVSIPVAFRGGCPGGAGGNSGADQLGHGGGAIYLIAGADIVIDGTINASGGAGRGGLASVRGGSGGGSGGMIGLDAEHVLINGTARVFANGGGGGEGAGTNADGGDGTESSSPLSRGQGGKGGNTNAGDGGDGGFTASDAGPGDNGSSSAAGGGGGGAVGVLVVFATELMIAGQVSPMPE